MLPQRVARRVLAPFGKNPVPRLALPHGQLRTLSSLHDDRTAIIGVRRETKNRWERRAPIVPSHIGRLRRKGVTVLVQPSNMRYFTDDEYRAAGATVTDDLSEASVIFGVKEVPIDEIMPNKTYVCFSHTIKAQDYNMHMLDAMLERNTRLIDYERMLDGKGRRVIGFGRFAGCAGMIDLLRGLGDRMLGLGYTSPFLGMGYSDYYHSLSAAKTAIQLVRLNIKCAGMPKHLSPFIFAFTGSGKVAQGAFEVFEELPHEYISVSDIEDVKRNGDSRVLYGVKLGMEDLVQAKDHNKRLAGFDKDDYKINPHQYEPIFHDKVAPYISALVNCMYWDGNYPRLLTDEQMRDLYRNDSRLLAIADISADIEGSIEFTRKCTTIDRPFLVHNPETGEQVYDWEAEGVLLGSVDNLPAELPMEASTQFADLLLPYVPELAHSDPTLPFDRMNDVSDTVRNAIITCHGELTPNYSYIADLRKDNEVTIRASKKRVILLGSGMVAEPFVKQLHESVGSALELVILSNDKVQAQALAAKYPSTTADFVDATNEEQLASAFHDADAVVSLLPATMHARALRACLKANVKRMVTSSYVSPELESLHAAAAEAGMTVLNEIGLDPGIDHLGALEVIRDAHQKGSTVERFESWCGGLPAPYCADNPLMYKFSWSARGVLAAGLNPAKYLYDGKEVDVPAGGGVFKDVHSLDLFPTMALEGIPNRNSLIYKDVYQLNDATTILRGTLRFAGFCNIMRGAIAMSLLDDSSADAQLGSCTTWQQASAAMLNCSPDQVLSRARDIVHAAVGSEDEAAAEKAFKAIEELGVLSPDAEFEFKGTMIDSFCHRLTKLLAYGKGEKDMVALAHDFVIRHADGSRERVIASLSQSGSPFPAGPSAMALTVGTPAALATKYLLEDRMEGAGVVRPTDPALIDWLLKELAEKGIAFKHKSYKLDA